MTSPLNTPLTSSKGYTSSYRGSNAPGAFYQVNAGDFGQLAPAQPTLTYEAGSGSLATGTAFVQIAWITAEGESLPSTELGVAVSASTGAVLVAIPAVPTNGATIIGWSLFSAAASAGEEQNVVATSTSPAPAPIATSQGAIIGFPIATTSALLKVDGTGAVPPLVNQSGIQQPMPSIAAHSTADYDFIVPNQGSQWKTYKSVQFVRPNGVPETAGISISAVMDCIAPTYGQLTNNASGVYQQVSVSNGTYVVVNGNLFVASQSGSANTATSLSAQPAGFAAAAAKGSTFTDGSVVWLSLGKAVLVRAHFTNVNSTTAEIPAAQQYDLFEL